MFSFNVKAAFHNPWVGGSFADTDSNVQLAIYIEGELKTFQLAQERKEDNNNHGFTVDPSGLIEILEPLSHLYSSK